MQPLEEPVIVCGLGRIGWPVLEYLRALDWPIIAIDLETSPDDPRLHGVKLLRGNFRDTALLKQAGIMQARGVIILANDDLTNLAACLELRRLNPTVRIVVRLFNENLVAKLGQTVANVVALSSSKLAGPLIATTALSGDVLARFRSSQCSWQIERITVGADSPLIGMSDTDFAQKYPSVEIMSRRSSSSRLTTGETMLFLGPASDMPRLREAASGEEGLTAKWAGKLKRFARTLYTTIIEVEWPVKLAACIFFTVVLVGSVICWLSGLADTLPRGLFRTLNIMVTSADLREQDYPAPWQHVFISFLKLSGLLLTAAFTALLTNYLVRVRLRGVLSISRVPESGHVVLCGLGTVGLRVLEELRQHQVPVVVLEKVEGSRFIGAARQLGATVLLCDGTVPANLTRAHTAQARALVAVTSSDLANVEIALLAREQNPNLRVIVRLDDSALADALQQTAQLRFALGLPPLIAPAFVLPLFGDRFLSMFWMDQVLHIVLEIVVGSDAYGLLGITEQQAEEKLGCWIVRPQQTSSSPLSLGEAIMMIVPARHVSEVLKRCYEITPGSTSVPKLET